MATSASTITSIIQLASFSAAFPEIDAVALNDSGEVVGAAYPFNGAANTSQFVEHAVLWINGKPTDIGGLPGYSAGSYASDINNSGQIIGYSLSGTDQRSYHSFIWQNGTLTDLGTLGGSGTAAYTFTNSGQIFGESIGSDGYSQDFSWQNGVLTQINSTVPDSPIIANYPMVIHGGNNSGDLIGDVLNPQQRTDSYIFKNGTMTNLGNMGLTYVAVLAESINSSDEVVGFVQQAYGANAPETAFIWQNGTMSALPGLGGVWAIALSVNNAGIIVGAAQTSANGTTESHAVMWVNGAVTDLNSLLPANSGWVLQHATAINNKDQVIGFGTYQGVAANFELTLPLPDYTAATAVETNKQNAFTSLLSVVDGAAAVQSNLDGLESIAKTGYLASITLTDSGTPNITVSLPQLSADAGAINAIFGNYTLTVSGVTAAQATSASAMTDVSAVAISDSASAISTSLDALESLAAVGKLSSINLTDGGIPTIALTAAQLSVDTRALADISGYYTVTVTAPISEGASVTGLSGHGTVVSFSGSTAGYSFTPGGDGTSLTVGTVHLSNVTALHFTDYQLFVASATPAAAGAVSSAEVTNLYAAVFARTPDVAGLAYYEAQAAANPTMSITTFAENFLSSPEYTGNNAHNYAQTADGDAQFITDTYSNLLHRAPGSGDVAWYQANVVNPILASATPGTAAYTQAELLAHADILADFSQSAEFLGNVQITAQHPADTQHWLILI